jgi:hypothetical protein
MKTQCAYTNDNQEFAIPLDISIFWVYELAFGKETLNILHDIDFC